VLYQDQMLTHKIIAAAIEVHKILGPGLLESAYKSCLSFELESIGLTRLCTFFRTEGLVYLPAAVRPKDELGD